MSEPVAQMPEKLDTCKWVMRHIGHVIGSSILLLPHAVAQIGILPFCAILALEAYFMGQSLTYLCEMVADQPRRQNIEHTNYFTIVEHNLGSHNHFVRYAVRGIFIFDVLICTSFYFKVTFELLQGTGAIEFLAPKYRPACEALTCILLAILLILSHYWQSRKSCTSPSVVQSNLYNFRNSRIDRLVIHNDENVDTPDQVNTVSMGAVVKEMYNYDRKRSVLLFCVMLLILWQYTMWRTTGTPEYGLGANETSYCPGFQRPELWIFADLPMLTAAISVVIFSLMNYAIMLPVCLEELALPLEEYTRIVTIAKSVLFAIFTIFALAVYATLGNSTPALFTTALDIIFGDWLPIVLPLCSF